MALSLHGYDIDPKKDSPRDLAQRDVRILVERIKPRGSAEGFFHSNASGRATVATCSMLSRP